jgi:two-component system NtrC family sensor kinase
MKRNPYDGLRKFILAAMIIVPFVPFITVCGIGYYHFTSSLENSTIASMRRIVHDHRRMIESFLVERKADLEFILNTRLFEDLRRPEYLTLVFKNLQIESQAFVDLGIFDENGRIYFSAGLERKVFFVLTLAMLAYGLLSKLGVV